MGIKSIFSSIGGFAGRLLGSEKALEATVKGVSSALDKLVYTKEEEAEDADKQVSEARSMVVQWMVATQGQNLARRLIALSITGVWISQYVLAQIVSVVAVFTVDPARLKEVVVILQSGAADMSPAVMLILAFYFTAPYMGGIAKAVTAKFEKDISKK